MALDDCIKTFRPHFYDQILAVDHASGHQGIAQASLIRSNDAPIFRLGWSQQLHARKTTVIDTIFLMNLCNQFEVVQITDFGSTVLHKLEKLGVPLRNIVFIGKNIPLMAYQHHEQLIPVGLCEKQSEWNFFLQDVQVTKLMNRASNLVSPSSNSKYYDIVCLQPAHSSMVFFFTGLLIISCSCLSRLISIMHLSQIQVPSGIYVSIMQRMW